MKKKWPSATALRGRDLAGKFAPFGLSTVRALAPNKADEFLTWPTYSFLLLATLKRGGRHGPGVLTDQEWKEVIVRHFQPLWSPVDRQKVVPSGRKRSPVSRWNGVQAYALLEAIDAGKLFLRTNESAGAGQPAYLVGAMAHHRWLLWAAYQDQPRKALLGIKHPAGAEVYYTGLEIQE